MELFYIIIIISYFKMNGWIYMSILGVLIKNLVNLILFPPILPNFGGMKIWDFFKEIKSNECSLLPISFTLI